MKSKNKIIKNKIIKKSVIRIDTKIYLIIFAIIIALLFYFIPTGLTKSKPSTIPKNNTINPVTPFVKKVQPQSGPGLPVRLKIPKIKVNAKFENVGLTAQGAIDVPKNFTNVAWYNLSSIPGEKGSSIITGHYGRKNGRASVFDNLHKLRVGDKLSVEDEKGNVTRFKVREIRRYTQNSSAVAVFNQKDDGSHLNLITCEGTWDKASKSYSSRLVIFTDKE